jgi:hypothetical protein
MYLTLDMQITWLSTTKLHASDLLNKHGIEDDQASYTWEHMAEDDQASCTWTLYSKSAW